MPAKLATPAPACCLSLLGSVSSSVRVLYTLDSVGSRVLAFCRVGLCARAKACM